MLARLTLDYASYGLRLSDWTVWTSLWFEFASGLPGALVSGCLEVRLASLRLRACVSFRRWALVCCVEWWVARAGFGISLGLGSAGFGA